MHSVCDGRRSRHGVRSGAASGHRRWRDGPGPALQPVSVDGRWRCALTAAARSNRVTLAAAGCPKQCRARHRDLPPRHRFEVGEGGWRGRRTRHPRAGACAGPVRRRPVDPPVRVTGMIGTSRSRSHHGSGDGTGRPGAGPPRSSTGRVLRSRPNGVIGAAESVGADGDVVADDAALARPVAHLAGSAWQQPLDATA